MVLPGLRFTNHPDKDLAGSPACGLLRSSRICLQMSPSDLATGEAVTTRAQIDHSKVESFGGHDRMSILSRVYLKKAVGDKARIYVFNHDESDVKHIIERPNNPATTFRLNAISNLPRFHHPPPVAPPPSTGLVLPTLRRPPTKSPPPVSHGTAAGLIPWPCSRPFAAATRLPPAAALPPVFSSGRAPSSCRCPAPISSRGRASADPQQDPVPPPPPRSYAAGRDPTPRIHVPAIPSTPPAACTRHDTSCLPTSPPTPQSHITPAGIRGAVQPRPCVQSLLVCSLDSRANTASKNMQKELRILMSEVQLYHGDYCGRSKH
ncbi:wiskott-Aldrich syndrome protein homolog 1-like [Triticum dicoccoides]|uniref:wiskott-Aldrich syndrome protein homolog 1-like n=1 Tax=Triticum dicoccoides TaxID=85692 RepID=UPI0018909D62|nr:wiskott-Aldrich syndrome protein homolog 1-like [Triticum dicoccoides]